MITCWREYWPQYGPHWTAKSIDLEAVPSHWRLSMADRLLWCPRLCCIDARLPWLRWVSLLSKSVFRSSQRRNELLASVAWLPESGYGEQIVEVDNLSESEIFMDTDLVGRAYFEVADDDSSEEEAEEGEGEAVNLPT